MRSEPSSIAYVRRFQSLPIRFAIGALICCFVTSIIFLAFPGIDLEVSRLFYAGSGMFSARSIGWVKIMRSAFVDCFYLCIAVILAGLIITRGRARTWLRLPFAQWAFLAVCLAVGPGLVANVGFKDHWGRARPNEVVEFGGKKAFTPPLLPSNQCDSNCSFVSGEAAAVFLPFYAMALLLPQSAALLLVSGTVCGLTAGLIRVAQGGHFLSDVIFAGIFMLLTVILVHMAVFRYRPTSERLPVTPGFLADDASTRSDECLGRVWSTARPHVATTLPCPAADVAGAQIEGADRLR
jgi:lipid A 4'-phosphatase